MTTVIMSKEEIIGVLHAIHNEAKGVASTTRGHVPMYSLIKGNDLEHRLLYALYAIELAALRTRQREDRTQQAPLKLASSQ